jgi:hypothetical protein
MLAKAARRRAILAHTTQNDGKMLTLAIARATIKRSTIQDAKKGNAVVSPF